MIPRKMDMITTTTTTTMVPPMASLREGQVTFLTSTLTSPKKSFAFPSIAPARLKYTGQEGVEPPTSRFGVWRSNQLELLAY